MSCAQIEYLVICPHSNELLIMKLTLILVGKAPIALSLSECILVGLPPKIIYISINTITTKFKVAFNKYLG